MNTLLFSISLLISVSAFGQQAPSFEQDGVPFPATNCEITWGAPTNRLPKALWIYKTIPQRFSKEAVSHLVALGSFTSRDEMKDTVEDHAGASPEELAVAANAIGFENVGTKRNLAIYPATGYIHYIDQEVDGIQCPIEDVPNENTAQELGLKLLALLGIPRSDLATKPNSAELLIHTEIRSRGHFDREQHKRVDEGIDSRAVMFVRRIDGVSFAGNGAAGGLYTRFASHATVAQLELVWRNLQPYKKYQVAGPTEIVRWIKDGKAVVILPDVDRVNPRAVKKLTITGVSPLYAGEAGDILQHLTYPFANLTALVDTGQTTNISIDLYCPILTDHEVTP